MSNPSISVVLPTYNVEKYISRCLDSCLSQSLSDFEIVIVDDCGCDKSIEIASAYAKKDSRIRIIKNKKNMGTYHARRVGAESSIGDYIVFLDPDDELAPLSLRLIYEEFLRSSAEILFFGVEYLPANKWYKRKPVIYPDLYDKTLLEAFFSKGNVSYACGTLGKAYSRIFLLQLYSKLNINEDFRFVYAEDMYLFLASVLERPKFSNLYHVVYLYYQNYESITKTIDEKSVRNNIFQYEFFLNSIINMVSLEELSSSQAKIMKMIINGFKSDNYLMYRDIGGAEEYFLSVFKALIVQPSLRITIRMLVFLLSFTCVRL